MSERFPALQNHSVPRQPVEIYHLSHDLRGPLNSILGFAELLYEGIEGPVNEIQMEDLAAIKQSAQNLLRLINTIVDLSKVDAGKMMFNEDAVLLHTLVRQYVTAKQTDTNTDTPEIVLDMPPTLPSVKGDPERVQQIIRILIDFAQTYKKSSLTTITATIDSSDIIIKVTATDLVLSPQKMAELFELTVTVDAAGRSELGVGGLTLPLAKQLTEQQQGQLWAKSTSIGTEFFLKLPRYDVANG